MTTGSKDFLNIFDFTQVEGISRESFRKSFYLSEQTKLRPDKGLNGIQFDDTIDNFDQELQHYDKVSFILKRFQNK